MSFLSEAFIARCGSKRSMPQRMEIRAVNIYSSYINFPTYFRLIMLVSIKVTAWPVRVRSSHTRSLVIDLQALRFVSFRLVFPCKFLTECQVQGGRKRLAIVSEGIASGCHGNLVGSLRVAYTSASQNSQFSSYLRKHLTTGDRQWDILAGIELTVFCGIPCVSNRVFQE